MATRDPVKEEQARSNGEVIVPAKYQHPKPTPKTKAESRGERRGYVQRYLHQLRDVPPWAKVCVDGKWLSIDLVSRKEFFRAVAPLNIEGLKPELGHLGAARVYIAWLTEQVEGRIEGIVTEVVQNKRTGLDGGE